MCCPRKKEGREKKIRSRDCVRGICVICSYIHIEKSDTNVLNLIYVNSSITFIAKRIAVLWELKTMWTCRQIDR